MFTSVVAALALAASVSRVAASPVHHVSRVHAQAARNYRQDAEILEDYNPFHVRYLALDCQDKHNTTFFEDCCHPLLRTQKLSDRPSKCTPSPSASTSAVAAEPTAAVVDEDPIYDDDCDETTSSAAAAVTSSLMPVPDTTYATTYYGETTSVKPTSAHPTTSRRAATSTQEPVTSTQEPVTTHAPTTTKAVTSAAQATTSAASSGGSGPVLTGGFATFFTQNGVPGACGTVHDDYDLVVAADYRRYGNLSKQSDLCGKKVLITNTDNGKQVTATVADACPTCKNQNSLDLSLGAFDKIGARDTGMLPIKWEIV